MMAKDYTDKATLKAAKAEWAEVFANMKRLDMVQIPAGDPGKRPPNELLASTLLLPCLYINADIRTARSK